MAFDLIHRTLLILSFIRVCLVQRKISEFFYLFLGFDTQAKNIILKIFLYNLDKYYGVLGWWGWDGGYEGRKDTINMECYLLNLSF